MSKYPIYLKFDGDDEPIGFTEFPFTLPIEDGTNGQVLVTDGSGTPIEKARRIRAEKLTALRNLISS